MKYFNRIIFLIFAVLMAFCSQHIYAAKALLNNIELPPVKQFDLPNKVRFFYIQDELPQITIVVSIGYGKLYENKNKAGVSELLAKSLSLGGSAKYPGKVLHEKIDAIGGDLSINASWEDIRITMRVLSRYSDIAFDILSDLISRPNLDNENIERARSLLLDEVKRKYDDADVLAFETAREIIFNGDGYGSNPKEHTVKSISKGDLISIREKYFCGQNIIIGASTSIDFTKIKDYIEKNFGDIQAGNLKEYSFNVNSVRNSLKDKLNKIYLIPKKIPQSTIIVGTVAPDIKDKRIYPLEIYNYILGGSSFNSRLEKDIREDRGLSYAVSSVIRFRKNTGVFLAYAQTKNETTGDVLSLLLKNITAMASVPVKSDELSLAKESIRNSYIFGFDTPLAILEKYIFLAYNGLETSYLTDYIARLDVVRDSDILANGKYLIDQGIIKLVVGSEDIAVKLSAQGEVVIIKP